MDCKRKRVAEPLDNPGVSHGLCAVCFTEREVNDSTDSMSKEAIDFIKHGIETELRNNIIWTSETEDWDKHISEKGKQVYSSLEAEVKNEINIGFKR